MRAGMRSCAPCPGRHVERRGSRGISYAPSVTTRKTVADMEEAAHKLALRVSDGPRITSPILRKTQSECRLGSRAARARSSFALTRGPTSIADHSDEGTIDSLG